LEGLSTIAGSWIGGANQTAMLEVFGSSKTMFAQMIAVDVLVANMDGIPSMGPKEDRIDKWLKADNTQIIALENQLEEEQAGKDSHLALKNLMVVLMVAFGITGLGHFLNILAPFFLKTIIPIRKILFH
jgi:uncharacterized membrane protein